MAAIVRGVLRRLGRGRGIITTASSSSSTPSSTPAAVRHYRYLHSASSPNYQIIGNKQLSEAERVAASKLLDEMDEEMQRELVEQVDAYLQWSSSSNDKGKDFVRRVLTYSGLVFAFMASWALGRREAESCLQHLYEEQRTQDEAAANQKPTA